LAGTLRGSVSFADPSSPVPVRKLPWPTTFRWLVALASVSLVATAAGSSTANSPATGRPLQTAVFDPVLFAQARDQRTAFGRARHAGAAVVRVILDWRVVAPPAVGGNRPPRFDADKPDEPGYEWRDFDRTVRNAVRAGLEPLVDIVDPPNWVERRRPWYVKTPYKPDPAELAHFATAAARRYSGSFEDLPRVRYWQVWNEPNLNLYLSPQVSRKSDRSPAMYAAMVNAFAAAVHEVHADNLVVAGGLSPFTVDKPGVLSIGPLRFMRELLCVSKGKRPRSTCDRKVSFDVWAHHPYTTGDPQHSAYNPEDVSMGDLGKMSAVLRAATRLGHVEGQRPPQFWITEMSWDTKPPDPRAVPIALQTRWTSEALYRAWSAGVTLVTWFTLRDDPPRGDYQSGLYYRGATLARDRPKPTLTAFRFPFVAYVRRGGIYVWGRLPGSTSARVRIEVETGSGWRRVRVLRANRFGIFRRFLPTTIRTGYVRAVHEDQRSRPFSLKVPPDYPVPPFGGLAGR
jgi:hypothetical protein